MKSLINGLVLNGVSYSHYMANREKVIYFLIDCGEVAYIGQSNKPDLRFAEHKSSGKRFDMVSVFGVPKQGLINEIEADLIAMLNPKLNQRIHANKWIRKCKNDDEEVCFSRVVRSMKFCRKSNEHRFIDEVISYKYKLDTCEYELYDKDGNAYHVSPKHVMKKQRGN